VWRFEGQIKRNTLAPRCRLRKAGKRIVGKKRIQLGLAVYHGVDQVEDGQQDTTIKPPGSLTNGIKRWKLLRHHISPQREKS